MGEDPGVRDAIIDFRTSRKRLCVCEYGGEREYTSRRPVIGFS